MPYFDKVSIVYLSVRAEIIMADSSLLRAEDSRLLWGWERFFEELSALIRDSQRYHGNANLSRSEWTLERLQTGITNVVSLKFCTRAQFSVAYR